MKITKSQTIRVDKAKGRIYLQGVTGTIEDKLGPKLFDKKIWTIDDVASFTGISKSSLYKMTSLRRRESIPFRKRSGKLYFLPEEVMNWIEEGDPYE